MPKARQISREKRSKIMKAIKSTNTKPELTLRHELFRIGYRYRKNYGAYDIDIAFPSKKLGVFVDGCFWHSCPLHGHKPKSNLRYWNPKLKRNKDRDIKVTDLLKLEGWEVMRFWEHDVEKNLGSCTSKIVNKYKVLAN